MEKTQISTGAAILVSGVLIAGAILYSHFAPAVSKTATAPTTATQPTTPSAPQADIKKVSTANEPYIGNSNAPVTIAYWSDYQCPFCKKFEEGAFAQIKTNYVDTGKVRIVFKDFAFLGEDSITASMYARAIWELYPQQYFAWREAMYGKQDDEGDQGFGDEASIKTLTATISGIDVAKVSQAVVNNSAKYQAIMDADKAEGKSMGVSGTPGFVLGTRAIAGAVAYSQFQAAIDALLK